MNKMLRQPLTEGALRRRAEIFAILDEIGEALDLTETQFEWASQAYNAIGDWISGSDDPHLVKTLVYLQGSSALRTAVKPIGQDEFDVDLICFCPAVKMDLPPTQLKAAVGIRLREHKTYRPILEEKKRCWRVNCKGDFHLDLSPTIANPYCRNGGELVPDRKLRGWQPTNPKAYRAKFDERAALKPRLTRAMVAKRYDQSTVEPFPARNTTKGVLRRTVQLLKRHRDVFFYDNTDEIAPISVIITTLAMRAYEDCVRRYVFEDELDVLVETIRIMPHFVERLVRDGREVYAVWNETTRGENFAEGWNTDPRKAKAFYCWHEEALAHFEKIRDVVGLDQIAINMKRSFGDRVAKSVLDKHVDLVSGARKSGGLVVAPAIGLTTAKADAASTPMQTNTFFGDQ